MFTILLTVSRQEVTIVFCKTEGPVAYAKGAGGGNGSPSLVHQLGDGREIRGVDVVEINLAEILPLKMAILKTLNK